MRTIDEITVRWEWARAQALHAVLNAPNRPMMNEDEIAGLVNAYATLIMTGKPSLSPLGINH